MVSEAIIIGSGSSIKPYLSDLQPLLATKYTIACNYAYKHFSHTILAFQDRDFYVPSYAKKNPEKYPDIYGELKKEPLIIGLEKKNGISEFLLPNTYMINCPKKEISNPHLTGIFALCIAEVLEPKNIFLLGYDWSRQSIPENKNDYNPYSNLDIHYYSKTEINHRGQGYTGYYDGHNPDKYFKFFENSKSKIFNVSPNSNIQNFEKITYVQFFGLMSNKIESQNELRQYIKKRLCTK